MKGRFYVVGVGPGDPELMTFKAVRVLDRCQVWLAPAARKNGVSTALDIALEVIKAENRMVITHHFPMKKVHKDRLLDPSVFGAWEKAALIVKGFLDEGKDVALPTLGDPSFYSTGFYVCERLLEHCEDASIEIVPGISAIGAASAAATMPISLGDDRVAIVPAIFSNGRLREILLDFDTVVLMKAHKVMDRLVPILEELELMDKAVLVERASMKGERITRNLKSIMGEDLHYFSTVIVRRR